MSRGKLKVGDLIKITVYPWEDYRGHFMLVILPGPRGRQVPTVIALDPTCGDLIEVYDDEAEVVQCTKI